MTFVHLVAASCGGRLFPQSAITALPSLGRWCGIGFGLATHLLFAFTVWHLIWFLAGHAPTEISPEGGIAGVSGSFGKPLLQTLGLDALLAIIFAVPHSLLLLPPVRRWLTGCGIDSAMYGCFYCVVTCIVLLITILCWQPSDLIVWAGLAHSDRGSLRRSSAPGACCSPASTSLAWAIKRAGPHGGDGCVDCPLYDVSLRSVGRTVFCDIRSI